MVAFCLFLTFVFFCFLLIATMSFARYFLVRSLLSDFPAFLHQYFRYGLIWFSSVYLVTTAGFVPDQLREINNSNNKYMYVWSTYSKIRINRVSLPILLVVS